MRWLRLWRRRWCLRRGHPVASWSPVAMSFYDANDDYIEIKQWRCAAHDRRPVRS